MKPYVTILSICFLGVLALGGCKRNGKSLAQAPKPMHLKITFETGTTNGRYSPRNVHAVWVEYPDGKFITTLDLWGSKHARQLTEFKTAVGDLATAVQARTGATQRVYGAYSSEWDLTDAAGNIVPNGDYVIRFELTSDNANKNNYHRATVPFKKTNTVGTTDPIDQGGYSNIVLDYQFVTETI